MNFENLNIWCWLIPALVGIICGILGYLIGKGSTTVEDNSTEILKLKTSNSKLQAALDVCNKKAVLAPKTEKSSENLNSDTSTASFAASTATSAIAFDASAAKAEYGKTIKHNDLKVVEGIGPKIEGMFKEHDIKTWKALSEASVADCQKVLDTGGKRYKIHDPASWPMQSKMCYEGKWNDLARWQEEHKHGKL
ncbi:hypothetical protein [Maribacter sp. ACAM166]|uniref:hypothetical protein n=1 Tax=Maribacter sp. ACAM166 TaxID=2508996 RepID=UPI0010FE5F55|nr:hypothetical protein [Maribacter sp. ACAM166]TLP73155.1 hypothetical protein ES765_17660 [Maribacter sp. ACAM166]